MNQKVKKIITGLIAGTLILGGLYLLPGGKVKFCDSSNYCYNLTSKEYNTLKSILTTKQSSGQVLTYNEYKTLIAIYNFEAQKKQGLKLSEISKNNLIQKINSSIK